jgi:copper(I)-binding protein
MGPLSLSLTALPSGVVLIDATGTTSGNPFIRFLNSGKTLTKGASVNITLTFTAASSSEITFGTEVVVL